MNICFETIVIVRDLPFFRSMRTHLQKLVDYNL